MARVKVFWEVVSPGARRALSEISRALGSSGFSLAGGTAMALFLGHRSAEDWGFFSPTFRDPQALFARLREKGLEGELKLVAPGTLCVTVDEVPVSFFGYGYGLLQPLVFLEAGLVPLADPLDIAWMKLLAVAQGGSRKDLVDVWAFLRTGVTLGELLSAFQRKYGIREVGYLLRALTYFDDAEAEPPLALRRGVSWDVVKVELERWVTDLIESGTVL
ncbi:MAG: nucleotidyl transferase AbiEii/AbiGii toxin family protein [Thermoanaerobaculum sp.]